MTKKRGAFCRRMRRMGTEHEYCANLRLTLWILTLLSAIRAQQLCARSQRSKPLRPRHKRSRAQRTGQSGNTHDRADESRTRRRRPACSRPCPRRQGPLLKAGQTIIGFAPLESGDRARTARSRLEHRRCRCPRACQQPPTGAFHCRPVARAGTACLKPAPRSTPQSAEALPIRA